MWISGIFLRATRTFSQHANCGNLVVFHRLCWKRTFKILSTVHLSTFHRVCGKMREEKTSRLQTGIDVGCDVTDVILQVGIALTESYFYFFNRVMNGGVILIQLLADIRQT